MHRFPLRSLALALALAGLGAASPLAAQTRPLAAAPVTTDADRNLVGAWVITLTPDPASGAPPFRQLYTFHADGTLVEVDDNAPAPPFPFTPGHGVWKREKGAKRTYSAHYLNLMYDAATFASNGEADIRIRVRLSEDLDSLTGTGHAIFRDADGNVLFAADGALTGERIMP